jgi:hypothetical protein
LQPCSSSGAPFDHDPDPEEASQSPLDCQYQPIARADFAAMSCFGRQRLRTALVISNSA